MTAQRKKSITLTFASAFGLAALIFIIFGYRPAADGAAGAAVFAPHDGSIYMPEVKGEEVAVLTSEPRPSSATTRRG